MADASAAGRELQTAIARIVAEAGPQRRLDELIELSRQRQLSSEELQEFQRLLAGRRAPSGT